MMPHYHGMALLVLFLSAWTQLHAQASAVRQDNGLIAMENSFVKFTIDPQHGGSIVSFIHKPSDKDVIPPGRPDSMGGAQRCRLVTRKES